MKQKFPSKKLCESICEVFCLALNTKRFKSLTNTAINGMKTALQAEQGKITYQSYVRALKNHHTQFLDQHNIYKINDEKLQNYPFLFYFIAEQAAKDEALAKKLSLTDLGIRDIDFQLSKTTTLRQFILKKAFSGQLVPQNRNDEPASQMLARIEAEITN